MTRHTWNEDVSTYAVGDPDSPKQVFGGYSQWVLGPGADFNPSEEYRGLPEMQSSDFRAFIEFTDISDPLPVAELANFTPTAEEDEEVTFSDLLGGQTDIDGGFANIGGGFGAFDVFSFSAKLDLAQPFKETEPLFTDEDAGTVPSLVARLPVAIRSLPTRPVELTDEETAEAPTDAVINAFIDDGINPVLDRFTARTSDGNTRTRFDFFWNQSGVAPNPSTVRFGKEILGSAINAALNGVNAGDEVSILRELGLVWENDGGDSGIPAEPNPLNLSVTHGTFVSEMAAGYDPEDPNAHKVRLIGVKMPPLASQDTSGLSLLAAMMAAIDYVFDRSRRLSIKSGVALPLVLTLSYGVSAGPRDGGNVLEQMIKNRSEAYRTQMVEEGLAEKLDDTIVQIVIAAGNSLLAQGHVTSPKATVQGGEKVELNAPLRVQPQDRTSSFVEYWIPPAAKNLVIAVTLPDGSTTHFTIAADKKKTFARLLTKDGTTEVVARIKTDCAGNSKLFPLRLTLCIAPTHILDLARAPAPSGVWIIKVSATVKAGEQIVGWALRDEAVTTFGERGRQAYFEDSHYTENLFDLLTDVRVDDPPGSSVSMNGSISGIATLETDPDSTFNAHMVGGCEEMSGEGAAYSAADQKGKSRIIAMLPSETSRALPGRLGAGSRTGSTRTLNGTSVAAPQMARLLTEMILEIDREDRGRFRAVTLIDHAASAPEKPIIGEMETRSDGKTRAERTRFGNLPAHDGHIRNRLRRPAQT